MKSETIPFTSLLSPSLILFLGMARTIIYHIRVLSGTKWWTARMSRALCALSLASQFLSGATDHWMWWKLYPNNRRKDGKSATSLLISGSAFKITDNCGFLQSPKVAGTFAEAGLRCPPAFEISRRWVFGGSRASCNAWPIIQIEGVFYLSCLFQRSTLPLTLRPNYNLVRTVSIFQELNSGMGSFERSWKRIFSLIELSIAKDMVI